MSEKKEHTDLDAARRASLIDEEARRMRAHELAVEASSCRVEDVARSTTERAYITVGTTDARSITE